MTAPQGRAESRVPDSWGSCSHLPAQNPSGQHSPELYSCISAAVTHRLIASTPPLISPLVALRLQLGSLQHTARCLAPHTCPPSPEQCLNLALQPQFSGRFLRAAPQAFIVTQKHSWFPVKAQRLKQHLPLFDGICKIPNPVLQSGLNASVTQRAASAAERSDPLVRHRKGACCCCCCRCHQLRRAPTQKQVWADNGQLHGAPTTQINTEICVLACQCIPPLVMLRGSDSSWF